MVKSVGVEVWSTELTIIASMICRKMMKLNEKLVLFKIEMWTRVLKFKKANKLIQKIKVGKQV